MTDATPSPDLCRFRFGESEFDESRFELTVRGARVEVQRRPLEVLAFLLRNVGEVVTREELLERIWDGRPTVEHVINNALAKLRNALGEIDGARIVTRPRVGYLFTGPVEKVAVGRRQSSAFSFVPGYSVPKRENFTLESLLGRSHGNEVWLGRHARTGERRVYKFSLTGENLIGLKRESSLFRVLRSSLGDRDDFVRMLDWNFESSPYFIEYAYGGIDLARWDENGGHLAALPIARRIALFLQIVDAVAAAHSVGVLHKDLKPSNVLVTAAADGTVHARVADFGSGHLLEHAQAAGISYHELMQTQGLRGQSLAGTAHYIAPELLRGRPATVQSDVYALGVMLYQFLVGRLAEPLVPGWEREIPDALLVRDIADATDGDVQRRMSSAAVLSERLRTLEARRQEAAAQEQNENRLRMAAESARARRARRPLVFAAFGLLIAGLAASTALYMRELHTRQQLLVSQDQAKQEARRTQSVLAFLQENVLGVNDPFRKETTKDQTIQSALSEAVHRLDQSSGMDASTEAMLRMTLGSILIRIAEPSMAEQQLRRVIAILTKTGESPALLAQSRYALAQALTVQSRFSEAGQELTAGDAIRARLPGSDARTARIGAASWGTFYMDQQQCGKAIPHLEQALRLASGNGGDDWDGDLARISLGQCYTGASRFKDAEHISRELLDRLAARPSPSGLTRALAQSVYGEALMYERRYADAEPALEAAYQVMQEKLGLANIRTISVINVRCNLLFMTKALDKALVCVNQAYDAIRLSFGEKNWATWSALSNVGTVEFMLGQYARAAATLDTAREGLERTLGVDKPATLLCDYYLAYSRLKLHQAARAASLVAKLEAPRLEEAEPGAPWAARIAVLTGLIDMERGQREKGLIALEQALKDAALAADSLDTSAMDAKAVLAREHRLRAPGIQSE